MIKEDALYEVAKALDDFLELVIEGECSLKDLGAVDKIKAIEALGRMCENLKIAFVSPTRLEAHEAEAKVR